MKSTKHWKFLEEGRLTCRWHLGQISDFDYICIQAASALIVSFAETKIVLPLRPFNFVAISSHVVKHVQVFLHCQNNHKSK